MARLLSVNVALLNLEWVGGVRADAAEVELAGN
jgi:hypothetical protein